MDATGKLAVSQGESFSRAETYGTPVFRIVQQRSGRSHLLTLLLCCVSQPMADNYALMTDVSGDRQMKR